MKLSLNTLIGLLAIVILFGCSLMPERDLTQRRIEQGIAAPILGAIAQYERTTGHLPIRPQELIPTYLAAIPKLSNGEEFIYTVSRTDNYRLCFDECCYLAYYEVWDCTKAAPEN